MHKLVKILGVSVVLAGILAVRIVVAQDAAAPAAAPAADKAAATEPAKAAATEPAKAEPKFPAMPAGLELRKTGMVNIMKDASGKVTGIKLIVTSYDITLDEGSKALEGMDGQKVRVTGTINTEDGKKWFTVKSVEPVVAAGAEAKPVEAKPAAEKPAEKPAEAPAAK